MTYLLILLIVGLVVSPLLLLKQSPRQLQQEQLRRHARLSRLRVKLSMRPDVREGEKSGLDCACYCLPWIEKLGRPGGRLGKWILVRDTRRGIASNWDDWRWLTPPAPETAWNAIGTTLRQLPEEALGLEAGLEGLEYYWTERPVGKSSEEAIASLVATLHTLIDELAGLDVQSNRANG